MTRRTSDREAIEVEIDRVPIATDRTERSIAMRRSKSVAHGRIKVSLDEEIAHLRGLELKSLRARWKSVTGREAPSHLSRHLLFAIVAYRVQAEVLGDLDVETVRLLKKVGSARSGIEVVPLTDAFDQRRREFLPGTVLTREWNGRNHRVMVVKEGFAWEGHTHESLSKIAHAITGTKWNGPRFFGLRDKTPAEVK
jgi:Protein of unknown function (DUF2924)